MNAPARLFADAADAAATILRSAFRMDVTKVLDPLDDDDFVKITDQLSRDFLKIAGPVEIDHVATAISILDVDWVNMTPDQVRRVTQAANLALRPIPNKVLPAFSETFTVSYADMVDKSARRAVRKFKLGIEFTFDEQDRRIVDFASKSQAIYVTNEYKARFDHFDERARREIADGLDKGLRSAEISENLANACTNIVHGRSRSYYNVVANAGMNRARTYGQLRSFEQAEIEEYRIHAVLDEATTDTCRFLHDKVFQVQTGLRTIERTEEGEDDVKATQPWTRTRKLPKDDPNEKEIFIRPPGRAEASIATVARSGVGTKDDLGDYTNTRSTSELQDLGVSMPPFHGNCRTTVVPVL